MVETYISEKSESPLFSLWTMNLNKTWCWRAHPFLSACSIKTVKSDKKNTAQIKTPFDGYLPLAPNLCLVYIAYSAVSNKNISTKRSIMGGLSSGAGIINRDFFYSLLFSSLLHPFRRRRRRYGGLEGTLLAQMPRIPPRVQRRRWPPARHCFVNFFATK